MLNEFFSPLQYYIQLFIDSFSNIQLHLSVIAITSISFVILHNLRHLPILRNISVILSFFPVLIHELGHAFAAQIFGGQVADIHMVLSPKKQQATGKQGFAITTGKNRFSFIFITLMGYISAPLMLFLGCYLIIKDLSFVFVALCLFFTAFYFVKTKQKWIPLILLLIIVYSGYSIIFEPNPYTMIIISIVYNLLLGLLLGETYQSIIITSKITFSKKKPEWDGSAMKDLTHLPVVFWWFIWTSFSIMCTYKAYQLFF